MSATVVRTFLPWYRRGLASGITAQSSRTGGRVQVPLTVSLSGRAGTAAVPLQLQGPHDVIGLDARQVIRVHPFAGCATFDASLFAHVELAEADLPWRFTPLAPDDQGRLRPWLALVVADAETAVLGPAAVDTLPALSCPTAELPNPAEGWAWAHVQVTRRAGQDIEEVVRDTPERATARLLCPRRLRPERAYLACVVPAFEGGRLAGLGRDPGTAADALAPAWGSAETAELPVYFHWRFSTATPGTFENLVRALKPRAIPADAATRTISVDAPGWGVRDVAAGSTIQMHGLLRPLGARDLPPSDDPALRRGIRAQIEQLDERPQIRPPLYGQDQLDRRTLPDPPEEPAWFRDLNLDPRHRIAAGLGAMVVRVLQEDLVAEAWRQLARAHRTPEEHQRRQLADALLTSIAIRSLPADENDTLAATAEPFPALGATLGRLTRAGGGLARRSQRLGGGTSDPPAPLRPLRALRGLATVPAGRGGPPRQEPGDGIPPTGFAPRFDDPAYDLLRSVHSEWVLPGLDDIPPDSVVLVGTNAAFTEAFLVGLNHELSRELIWRRYPVDRGGTFYRAFWPSPARLDEPVDVRGWVSGALGTHVRQSGSLVLLIRGELLRRYPGAQIYALRSRPGEALADAPILPSFSGRWGEDVTFVGFPLPADDAFANDELWFVIEEAAHRAHFGCDEATTPAPPQPAVWQDLQWGNADFDQRTHLPAVGPLAGLTLPVTGPPGDDAEEATWGRDAAHMAVITQQPPLRAILPARRWRPMPLTLDY